MQTLTMHPHKEAPDSYVLLEDLGPARVHNGARGARFPPPHPGSSLASGKAEAGSRAIVCLVDSIEFREGFPFDLAKEKSSLFPPAMGPASPKTERAGLPFLLGLPHHDLQRSVNRSIHVGPGWACNVPVSCPERARSSLPARPGKPSQ